MSILKSIVIATARYHPTGQNYKLQVLSTPFYRELRAAYKHDSSKPCHALLRYLLLGVITEDSLQLWASQGLFQGQRASHARLDSFPRWSSSRDWQTREYQDLAVTEEPFELQSSVCSLGVAVRRSQVIQVSQLSFSLLPTLASFPSFPQVLVPGHTFINKYPEC